MIAAAIIDRLLRRNVAFNLEGESCRMRAYRARAEATRRTCGDQTMMILHSRAPPEKIFPGRVAQLVDHPYKCRSGRSHSSKHGGLRAADPGRSAQPSTCRWSCVAAGHGGLVKPQRGDVSRQDRRQL